MICRAIVSRFIYSVRGERKSFGGGGVVYLCVQFPVGQMSSTCNTISSSSPQPQWLHKQCAGFCFASLLEKTLNISIRKIKQLFLRQHIQTKTEVKRSRTMLSILDIQPSLGFLYSHQTKRSCPTQPAIAIPLQVAVLHSRCTQENEPFFASPQKHRWVFRKYLTPCLFAMVQIAFSKSEKVLGGRNPPQRISSVKAFMKDVIIKKWMNAFVSLWEVSERLLFLSFLSLGGTEN